MIEFKNVSFTYDSVDRNAGIYNVNLKINDGEVIVFCGESGCGKTTISRLINGPGNRVVAVRNDLQIGRQTHVIVSGD